MSLTDQLRLTLLLICLISLSNAYEYDDDDNTLEGFVVEGDMVTPDDEDDGRFGSAPITDRDRSGKLLLCPNESSIYL